MTTLIQDVTALLNTVAPAGGVWYGQNTSETSPPAYPFIVWLRVVSADNLSLSGPSDMQNTRIQVEAIAPRIADAAALMNQIEAAFSGSTLPVNPITSQDLYEGALKAWRVIRDFSVWSSN
jgi:hypothetical protein